ncbi:threonine-phosphate decarboxylase CobD [Thalassospira sp.]|uniref:threonine-phosphate decarboxylase CobD n=1 Tax=Thalassospira sp. TaxID=1912094 RepID=UPI003AA880C7
MSGIENGAGRYAAHRAMASAEKPVTPQQLVHDYIQYKARHVMTNSQPPSQERPPINHGGAVDQAAQQYGIPACDWLDLSTGINPVAYAVPDIDPVHWHRLPLQSELDGVKSAAKQYYGLPATNYLVCAPGTQALIQAIPFWLKDQMDGPTAADVHVMGPTYGEHERCWQRARYHCQYHQTTISERLERAREILTTAETGSVVILVNPNNPDGAMFDPADIIALGKLAHDHKCWLVVDEAFMDCDPEKSVCSYIDQLPSTIILRSFGKFFGLAGARLGCAIMAADLAADLEGRIGPWAIPGPTLIVGAKAFRDHDWHEKTRLRLNSDAARLDRVVTDNSKLILTGGTSLFRYYEGMECAALADHLGKQGILIRLFDHDPNKVRFGIPGHDADWKRLESAMTHWHQAAC